MKYAVYPKPTLGPCRCQGCGEPLWWATRQTRRLGIIAFRFGWREEDGTLHRCPNWQAALARARATWDNEPVGISDASPDIMCDALLVADTSREGVPRLEVSAP